MRPESVAQYADDVQGTVDENPPMVPHSVLWMEKVPHHQVGVEPHDCTEPSMTKQGLGARK